MDLVETIGLGIYVCFFLLPFVQEDVAVFGAASACAAGIGNPIIAMILVVLGLSTSASIKYWIGRTATSRDWARKFTENPKVVSAGENVQSNLGKSLFTARFISPLRLPFFIASGFFNVGFLRFLIFVTASAIVYIGIAFGLFHVFGEVAGEKMKIYLPIVAIIILAGYFLFCRIFSARFSR